MKLINLNSKKGVINLLSDYILKNFDKKSNTIIQVTDFNHFFIVNGITDSNEVLNISEIKDNFVSEYQDLLKKVGYEENVSIMDLIKYNEKVKEETSVECVFFDSDRNLYHPILTNYKFTDDNIYSVDYNNDFEYITKLGFKTLTSGFYQSPLQITSEFPYGYSFSMGRTLLYYSEYIAHNIMKTVMNDKISILLSKEKNSNGEQDIQINYNDDFLTIQNVKSMILDVFDFNFETFNKKLGSYDICDDIKKPTESKPWLVKDINPKDLYVF